MDASKLATIPLFASLGRRELDRVAGWADEVDVDAGQTLIEEGRPAYEFFVIVEGTARVLVGDEEVRVMGPGEFFGEIGLSGHEPRTASVVADTAMCVAVMFEREFHQMGEEMPEVCEQISAAVHARRPG